jgi:eukaryotic-like serine/threonine-protein kinase
LDESCAGDEVLRGKVEELLAAHRQSGSFIATPRATLTTSILEDGETDLLIGQTIGHYRILNRISAGGMGTVYLGERADQQYEKKGCHQADQARNGYRFGASPFPQRATDPR